MTPGKTLATSLALGVALGWACVFAIPSLASAGVPARLAEKLPYLGFAAGLAWGVAMHESPGARRAFGYAVTPLVLGAVLWFFAVLGAGALVGAGLAPEVADVLPAAAFVLGAVVGLLPLAAVVVDRARR